MQLCQIEFAKWCQIQYKYNNTIVLNPFLDLWKAFGMNCQMNIFLTQQTCCFNSG